VSSIPSIRLAIVSPSPSTSPSMYPSMLGYTSLRPSSMIPTRSPPSRFPTSTPSDLPTQGSSESPAISYSAPPNVPIIEISLSDLIISMSLPTVRRLSTSDEDKILQMLLHSICVETFSMNKATVYECNIIVNPSANIEEGNAEKYVLTKKINGSVYFALYQDQQAPDRKELDERIAEVLEGALFLQALQNSNDGLLSSTKKVKVYFPGKSDGVPNLNSESKVLTESKNVVTRRYLSIIFAMTCSFVSIYVYQTKLRPILSSCTSSDLVQSESTISPPAYLETDEPFGETSILESNSSHTEIQVSESNNSSTPNTRNSKKGDPFREVKCHQVIREDDESDLMTTGTFELLWNESLSNESPVVATLSIREIV